MAAAAGPVDWETVQEAMGWAKEKARGFRRMDNTAVGLANGAMMTITNNAAPAMSYLASSVASG